MIALIIIGLVGILIAGAEALLNTAGEVEAFPDTAKNREWRQKQSMYQIDNLIGKLNILDLIFGLINNIRQPKSNNAKGSKWRLVKIIMWQGPDGETPVAIWRELKRYGIILIWHGFDGDRSWFYVRETQKKHAIYRLARLHRGGPSWAEQRAGLWGEIRKRMKR